MSKLDSKLDSKSTSKFDEYKEKITTLLLKYNISLDVHSLLKNIEISNRSYADVLDTFLLKYSEDHKVLTQIYNKEYPYDLEINKKIKPLKDTLYEIEAPDFLGVKFIKPDVKYIIDYLKTNNVLCKGLFVDIKYDIEPFMNYLGNIKLDLDVKYLSDGISNIFVVINQQTSPLINKVVLYEIFKKLKGSKEITHNFILYRNFKISILSNKLQERFYSFHNDEFSCVRDISFSIREYLDRNGFLTHFSSFCVDCISYILYLTDKKSPNYLKDFLKFKFTGYNLINLKEVTKKTKFKNDLTTNDDTQKNHDGCLNDSSSILVNLDNLKYVVRYPPADILNRLRYLNKEAYTSYFTKIGTSYFTSRDINSHLTFSNYQDYDVVLSKIPIRGSKKIFYDGNPPGDYFNFTDRRAYMFYSKKTHTLMIKFREEVNRELFYMYLISSCRFDYILIN